MKREVIGAQGEITIFSVSELPEGLVPFTDTDQSGRPIISHSESGHHHVLERAVKVLEKPDAPEGMQVLYALLDEPTRLLQDAADAHGEHMLAPGYVEFRIARLFDPFSEQARRVAD
jgi:hypothetical protein